MLLRNVSRRAWKVWRRDIEVYAATWKTNFLPPLLEPVLYVLAFGVGMGSLIGNVRYFGAEMSYLRFMAPGIVAVAIMFWSYFETTYSSYIRMYYQKTFEAIVTTPLLVEDVIAGEWLWGATKSVVAATLMLAVVGGFKLLHWPGALLVLPLAALGGLLFSAMGLITTAVSPSIEVFNVPTFVIIFPMFLFSGTFFPIDVLPHWARTLAAALPLTHVSLLVRGACLGSVPPGAAWSLLYLVVASAITAWLAFKLMKRRLVK
jgi:lipooligosaccharide transport system permease protein